MDAIVQFVDTKRKQLAGEVTHWEGQVTRSRAELENMILRRDETRKALEQFDWLIEIIRERMK